MSPTRRQCLSAGGLGLVGLSLAELLRAEEARRPSRPKSCVLFLLHGGPSQLDIWDMKPAAPAEVRGEFKPVATNVPGIQFVEHLPRLSRMADRFAIIRSMTHHSLFHNSATYFVITGQPPLRDLIEFTPTENDFPHVGAQFAWSGAVRAERSAGEVPAAVCLPDPLTDGPYTTPGQNAGFLGAHYAPFSIFGDPNADGFTVQGLAASEESNPERVAGRRSLLAAVDRERRWLEGARRVERMDRYQQRAFALLTSAATRRAFELSRESPRLRERYGRNKYGQSLLLARRLVEAGVRLVTVYWGGKVNNPDPYWDTHYNNNRRLKEELLPPFDQCFSAFLEDLERSGLLESTLVLCMGEFGRTPRFGQFTGNGVDQTGRDHWSQCYSIVAAGGGVKGGRVLGRSDRFAAYPAADPYTPQDLTATVLHSLGVNPRAEIRDGFGRSVPLSTGQVIEQLF